MNEPARQVQIGRPLSFTQAVGDEVCLRLSSGESLRQICRDDHMPCKEAVNKWVQSLPSFATQYAEARAALLDRWAEEIIEISDDGTNDWVERETKRGRVVILCDHEHVNRSRLRVDTRKWLLSKLNPRKYGDLARDGAGPLPDSIAAPTKENATERYLEMVQKSRERTQKTT